MEILIEKKVPFSVSIMDAEFNRTSTFVSEIRNFCKSHNIEKINKVIIKSEFQSDLQRKSSKLETSSYLKVYIDNDIVIAEFTINCNITENE
jgi:hypothetical protein